MDGFAEGGEGVAEGDELVGYVAGVAGAEDTAHDGGPFYFLGVVELVAAGDSSGVEVAEPLDVFLDGGDEVAFHNLHVVDVVEELDAGGVDLFADADAPGGVVCHVVLVVAFAVKELKVDGDAVVFRDGLETLEAEDAVAGAFVIGHAHAVAGEGDDVGDAELGGEGDVLAEVGFDFVVIFDAVEGLGDVAATGVAHGADEAVLARGFPVLDVEEVDALEADFGSVGAEVVEGGLGVAPAGGGLVDVAAEFVGGGGDFCGDVGGWGGLEGG